MLALTLLLLVPLGIRYLTSWHMAQLRERLQRADDELRELHSSYVRLREEVIDTRRRHRQYEVRRTFLRSDIHQAQQRLAGQRAPAAGRLAA